jgi:flagellin-like hook-associated protein FlgL
MVIQHNLASIFTQRELKTITGQKSKSTERLSSGYRINRSADDAAGLAISEKMRWQIRGLDKGADNISEGISLLQTGEGALNEVHAILQRVRELHVQALNDTNTEEDRHDIQKEVEASLEEIDRIRESTMFNTKPILKGNPYELIQISEDQEVEYTVSRTLKKNAASWLKIDDKMEKHPYNITQLTGDSEIMKSVYQDGEGNIKKEYYGKEGALPSDEWEWKGAWNPTINNNNPSAKFDFSGLKDSNTAVELYNKLFELMGTKISFPCGTCSEFVNSIGFGGQENGMEIESYKANPGVETDAFGSLNLSKTGFKGGNGYFEPISKLISDYVDNYDDSVGAESKDLEGEKRAVKQLADEIAADLTTKCIGILGKDMNRHFDRMPA